MTVRSGVSPAVVSSASGPNRAWPTAVEALTTTHEFGVYGYDTGAGLVRNAEEAMLSRRARDDGDVGLASDAIRHTYDSSVTFVAHAEHTHGSSRRFARLPIDLVVSRPRTP